MTSTVRSQADNDRDALTTSLFERIAQCHDETERERLRAEIVTANMSVAGALAHRFHNRGEANDDLTQVAYLGLIKAVNGFEPQWGSTFLSYAIPTMTGELKRHFRDKCWSVRPPRRIQDLQRGISATREDMSQELGRAPTPAELAGVLGASLDDVTEALSAQGCFTPSSLDTPLRHEAGSSSLGDLLPADDQDFDHCEARLVLAPILGELSETDQRILTLRFFEEWTQQQIADELGTSQMQVSRRLSRLLKKLREQLSDEASAAA